MNDGPCTPGRSFPPEQEGAASASAAPGTQPSRVPEENHSSILWSRIFDLIEQLKELPPEELEGRLAALDRAGENPSVTARIRLHFAIQPLPEREDTLKTGTVIDGAYRIVKELGRGGMGVVYEAVLVNASRQTVALKMIQPGLVLEPMRERFLQEMRSLGRLDHPGVAGIRHAGQHLAPGGTRSEYFTMECIAGSSLLEYLKAYKEPSEANLTEKLRLIRDAAIAVHYAHDRSVIHRDLKPSNMMVRTDRRLVIFDFGLSAALALAPGDDAPFSIGAEGTPPYMAPEQADAALPAPPADVYSLGAILYEMLAGEPVYQVDHFSPRFEKLAVVRNPPPRRPLERAEIPPVINAILDRALAPDPEDRYPSAAAFARAINRLLPAYLVAEPPHKWHPAAGVAVPATDWVLEERLGDGAHGQVWLAHNRPVLTKPGNPLIPPPRVYKFCATEDAARSLRREQRVFLALQRASNVFAPHWTAGDSSLHAADPSSSNVPALVPLEAWSLDEPPYYIAMRWIEGACDLRDWLGHAPWQEEADASTAVPPGSGTFREEAAIRIAGDVAEALQFASQNGVLHRDVSPSNILVREESGTPGGVRAWLVDFGLAAFDSNFTKSLLTKSITDSTSARLVGAPDYIAPEIRRGNPATTQSDIYSLGVVLYRLLRGDFSATLTEWRQHIPDPFLREDLALCLDDLPENRFRSPADLAKNLKELPARRDAAAAAEFVRTERERKQALELAAAKRAAYRKGVLRATGFAAAVVALLTALIITAVQQKREADIARAGMALEQAVIIAATGDTPGRRQQGLERLDQAAVLSPNPDQVRSTAAALFCLPELIRIASRSGKPAAETPLVDRFPVENRESTRALSVDGRLLAIARDLDSFTGTVDLIDANTGAPTLQLRRDQKQFPSIPIAENRMLQFSRDGSRLAVGGRATSRQVLVFSTTSGELQAYIYLRAEPTAMAWHPGGRLLATGSTDGLIRIWDLEAPVNPRTNAPVKNDFDLAPNLDTPALDQALCTMAGHRGAVTVLSFHPDTGALVSCDASGYLRIWTDFTPEGLPGLVEPEDAALPAAGLFVRPPAHRIETRVTGKAPVQSAEFLRNTLELTSADGSRETFEYQTSALVEEIWLRGGLAGVAWGSAAPSLCAITDTDTFWLDSKPLRVSAKLTGKQRRNPVAALWDPVEAEWALPSGKEFAQFTVQPDGSVRPGKKLPWEATPGGFTTAVMCRDGRGVCYTPDKTSTGKDPPGGGPFLRFFQGGQRSEQLPIRCRGDGVFQSLQWDPEGRLLAVCFTQPGGALQVKSWGTSQAAPFPVQPYPARTIQAESALPLPQAGGPPLLLFRSAVTGFSLLDAESGLVTSLNNNEAARQAFPMAVSQDGRLLAAVSDIRCIDLYRLPDCQLLARFTSLRSPQLSHVSWHPGGRSFATLTSDGWLQVWDLQPLLSWLTPRGLGF